MYLCGGKKRTMNGYSQTPQQERIKILQSLMPEVFDEGKIDWEKLKATLGEDVNFANERYVLNWAGKSDAFRIMQQPSSATLVPCREDSLDFDHTENIFIEGENMEVLKVLQKSYFGKVKMIYIDPPYNTGNDSFIYPDKFSETKEEYMKRVGDKDEEGYMTREGMFHKNSKENGQYHSNWLNMMMPRLYLAKSLLREDGVIFVSIDDNEVHNLRLLMNEIFGEENFKVDIAWQKRYTRSNNTVDFTTVIEHILVYSKSQEFHVSLLPRTEEADGRYSNPDNDPRGDWKGASFLNPATPSQRPNLCYPITNPNTGETSLPTTNAWRREKSVYEQLLNDNKLYWGADGKSKVPSIKMFLSEARGLTPINFWSHEYAGNTDDGTDELSSLFGVKVFDFPKPSLLVKRALEHIGDKDALILDFFAGSATTAHAVMQLNKEDGGHRKYICVQLPELCDEKSEAYKAGYKTIAEIGKERIRRAGAKIRAEVEAEQAKRKGQLEFEEDQAIEMPDLGFKVFKLSESNFKQWREIKGSSQEEWKQQMLDFINPVTENATTGNMVYELLLKSGKSLTSTIEHKNGYHAINGKELTLMLEAATQETVDAILAEHPQKVLALDNLFEGNDQLKTNTALQMRDAGVEFRTI